MSVCPECHETIVIGRACRCGEHKPVRRDYSGHQPDPVHDEREKVAALEARCARLAAALEFYADAKNSDINDEDGWYRVGGTPMENDGGDRARAALTADDAKLAAEWRAMKRVCHVAEDCRNEFYPAELIAALDKLAAVEASKEE